MTNKIKSDKTIADLFVEDPWVRSFMQEVYDMFGMPISSESCMNKSDKILFVWSMMTLVQEMKRNEAWISMKEEMTAEEAAYSFVESHFNKTGSLLLENITDYDPGLDSKGFTLPGDRNEV